MYLKTQIQWTLFHGKLKNWDWTLRRDTPEILRIHLVRNWIRERKRQSGGIIQKGELHERNPCAPFFFLRRNTWGNLTTSRLGWSSLICVSSSKCVYMCVTVWVHFGSILGPLWVHFGSIFGPFWFHFGSILGPFVHFGSILGPFRVSISIQTRIGIGTRIGI